MLFEKLNLNPIIIKNLKSLNYIKTTKIQSEVILKILDEKNILAISQTGTGKTAAYAIPIIEKLLSKKYSLEINKPKVLILAPSRELCEQIGFNFLNLFKSSNLKIEILHGGEDYKKQESRIENSKYDILISTPTRVCDLLKNSIINLENIEFFVLDEVDKIIEENFNSNLKYLNKKLPKKILCAFFSATMNLELEEVSNLVLKNPIKIDLTEKLNLDLVKQSILFIQKEHKYKSLLELLKKNIISSSIIFTNSKKTTDELVRFLKNNQIFSEGMHAGKSNVHREKVINNLKTKKVKFLVATDLAARGLDIENISHIFNFEIPTSPNMYIHRIGRCARAGKSGIAISLCSSTERHFIDRIENEKNIKFNVIKNKYHSKFAQKAKGEDAKPKFKSKMNNFGKTKKNPKFKNRILKSMKK